MLKRKKCNLSKIRVIGISLVFLSTLACERKADPYSENTAFRDGAGHLCAATVIRKGNGQSVALVSNAKLPISWKTDPDLYGLVGDRKIKLTSGKDNLILDEDGVSTIYQVDPKELSDPQQLWNKYSKAGAEKKP